MGKKNKNKNSYKNSYKKTAAIDKDLQDLEAAIKKTTSQDDVEFSNKPTYTNVDHEKNTVNTEYESKESRWPDALGIAIIALLVIGIVSTAIGNNPGKGKDQLASSVVILDENGNSVEGGDDSKDSNGETVMVEVLDSKDSMMKKEDDSVVVATTDYSTTNVKLAMLTPNGSQDVANGCDTVRFVNHAVPVTSAPLNASIQSLFDGVQAGSGNFIATQEGLSFVEATLENGVANVFLSGKVGPYNNACDSQRTFKQIRETALVFPTVSSVVFFLDGNKLSN